jgi:predicted RNA-binding Zn-ribbon protein involved in translation (DUF1610 family)
MHAVAEGKVEVPCPDCGQLTAEPVERVREHDVIPCSICGGLIDLSAEDCRRQVELVRGRRA